MAGFRMDDYVDVAERINSFYERFPEGSLQSGHPPQVLEIGGKPFIVYHALAYRTPDDPRPAHGWAWEPVPGPTQFTKDSELMNAETAAWGRAIVACGFSTKKIASAQEVRNRQTNSNGGATQAVDTRSLEEAVTALVGEKGGDLDAFREAMETARGESNFPEWLAFQNSHWVKAKKPFKAPAGVGQ